MGWLLMNHISMICQLHIRYWNMNMGFHHSNIPNHHINYIPMNIEIPMKIPMKIPINMGISWNIQYIYIYRIFPWKFPSLSVPRSPGSPFGFSSDASAVGIARSRIVFARTNSAQRAGGVDGAGDLWRR